MELLLANHHGDCLTCAENNQCELQRDRLLSGSTRSGWRACAGRTKLLPVDDSNPFFDFDPNKCMLCGICVRTCDEIVGVNAIDLRAARLQDARSAPLAASAWVESRCDSCGECVVRCPVGALAPKTVAAARARGADDLRLLRRGLRHLPGRARQPHRQRPGRPGQPGQPGPALRQGPLRLRVRQPSRPADHAA